MKVAKKVKWLGSIFVLMFLCVGIVNAQEQTSSPADCFDYYHFQSVQVSLGTDKDGYIPQEYVMFSGEIENQNDYPIVDGNVFVRIGKKNSNYQKEGNFIIDELVPLDNISLDSKEKKSVKFQWQIPQGVAVGEYEVDFFFSVGKKFNLGGLPFSNEIIIGKSNFNVQEGQEGVVVFDKSKTKVNGEKYNHIGAWPMILAGEKAEIVQSITNSSNGEKKVSVQYDLYFWDSLNEKDKLDSKIEQVSVPAGKSADLSYVIPSVKEPVYYLKITATAGTEKSIVNVRLTSNEFHPRLNFSGLTKFPLQKNQTETMFACFHNTSNDVFEDGKVTVILTDKQGNQISKAEYSGRIAGDMRVVKEDLVSKADYPWLKLTAVVADKDGKKLDQYETVYDCDKINSSKCSGLSNETSATETSATETSATSSAIVGSVGSAKSIVIALIGVLFMVSLIVIAIRLKKKSSVGLFLAVLLGGISFWGFQTPSAEAFNERSSTVSRDWGFLTSGGKNPRAGYFDLSGTCYRNADGRSLPNATFSQTGGEFAAFGSSSITHTVGMTSGGTTVVPGTTINFEYDSNDPFYNQMGGGAWDTPYGSWCSGINNRNCAISTMSPLWRTWVGEVANWNKIENPDMSRLQDMGERYVNVIAVKPSISIKSSNPSVINCSRTVCVVQNVSSPTIVTLTAEISKTDAAVYVDALANNGGPHCFEFIPLRNPGGGFTNDFPATSVSWNITIPGSQSQMLTVTKSDAGSGMITSSPAGITCGSDCSESYAQNTLVTLTAIADPGATFGGWSSNCSSISATQCQITMSAAATVDAKFNGCTPNFSCVPVCPLGSCGMKDDICRNSCTGASVSESFCPSGSCGQSDCGACPNANSGGTWKEVLP